MSAGEEAQKTSSAQEDTVEAKCLGTPWKANAFADRSRFMQNNSSLSDVEFSFRESAKNKAVVVPAHSFILSKNSPVFFNMLRRNTNKEKMVIEIADCDPEIFKTFLLHLYNNDFELSTECLQDLSRLATKYSVSSLVEKCAKFAESILTVYSVFAVLQCAEVLKDKKLLERCWSIVDLETNEVITTDDFLTINQDLMLKFLQRDSLRVREIELFKAFCNWAAFENKKQNQNFQIEHGKQLYSQLVNEIRFPLMSQREFAEHVPRTKLLHKDDIINMFSYFCSASFVDVRFSQIPRGGTLTRCRLFPASRKWFMYSGSCPEYLTLTVSSPLRLYGVRMFGSESGKYSVTAEIYAQNNPMEILATRKGIHVSENEMQNRYFGFDVFLDKPLLLEAGKPYTLKVLLNGPPSYYGCHGYSEVECDGKILTFSRDNCQVFSRFRAGQFAEVIFV